MRRGALTVLLAAALAGTVACGGTGGTTTAPHTAVPAPVLTAVPLVTPVTNVSGKLTVTGVALGANASATMHATPGASCSIVYFHPTAKKGTDTGAPGTAIALRDEKDLVVKTAGPDGTVTWNWVISPSTTSPGRGTVDVSCGTDKAFAAITITP